MPEDTERTAQGVYGWITCPKYPSSSFFVTTNQEDEGKSEGTVITGKRKRPVTKGLYAIVTGGMEEEDKSIEDALLREIREELKIDTSKIKISNEPLPRVVVHQDRDEKGDIVRFLVSGRQVSVPDEILKQLEKNRKVLKIPNDELLHMLTPENTRWGVYAIAKRMDRRLKRMRASA